MLHWRCLWTHSLELLVGTLNQHNMTARASQGRVVRQYQCFACRPWQARMRACTSRGQHHHQPEAATQCSRHHAWPGIPCSLHPTMRSMLTGHAVWRATPRRSSSQHHRRRMLRHAGACSMLCSVTGQMPRLLQQVAAPLSCSTCCRYRACPPGGHIQFTKPYS